MPAIVLRRLRAAFHSSFSRTKLRELSKLDESAAQRWRKSGGARKVSATSTPALFSSSFSSARRHFLSYFFFFLYIAASILIEVIRDTRDIETLTDSRFSIYLSTHVYTLSPSVFDTLCSLVCQERRRRRERER